LKRKSGCFDSIGDWGVREKEGEARDNSSSTRGGASEFQIIGARRRDKHLERRDARNFRLS